MIEPCRLGAAFTRSLHQHAVLGVVLELQVQARPGHRRLPARRVAVDVQRVRLVLDVLQPGEEHRVERGRRALRDPAAQLLLELAALDDVALGEAVGRGPLPHDAVQREGLPRLQHRVVDQLRRPADVDVAVRQRTGSGW